MHAFLDGRDTPPKSAAASLAALQAVYQRAGCGQTASLTGRFFAMDRDKRWDRVQTMFQLLTEGKASRIAKDPESGLAAAYSEGETDEFVRPTLICPVNNSSPLALQDGDSVICMNFRADRARELIRALKDPVFDEFPRPVLPAIHLVTLTEYDAAFPLPVAFPPERPQNILGQVLAGHGLQQLRIAETEKYAHVTFFFNGGSEIPFPGEDRILVPSPKVKTYDLQPEMSAPALTDQFVSAIKSAKYDVIICNFANPDMVGHSGNLKATIKAIETVDTCLARILSALKKAGGQAVITSDHGNAEVLRDPATGQPHTAHTSEPVPFIYTDPSLAITHKGGTLADIAPTLLWLLGLPVPAEMTGVSLLSQQSAEMSYT
jgi:2,3-bisphosphoglycerate-independent phosphoglycerate mutase